MLSGTPVNGRYEHIPVLRDTVASMLVRNPSGVYIDGTLGGGGHAGAILSKLDATGRLIGIDKDRAALAAAESRLAQADGRLSAIHGDFRDLAALLGARGIAQVDGIILDLGVSSYQIDTPERGFSYMHDGPLDMRMDRTGALTACKLVNEWSPERLEHVVKTYGEERLVKPLVRAIVDARRRAPITTTQELVEVIRRVVRHRPLYKTCARVFQALRIAVNDELGGLRQGIEAAIPLLKPAGRFGVITYHSLEDREVKHAFHRFARGCICPPGLPQCVCGQNPVVKPITRRPLYPQEDEVRRNPRARSAKLRMVERLSDSSPRWRAQPEPAEAEI